MLVSQNCTGGISEARQECSDGACLRYIYIYILVMMMMMMMMNWTRQIKGRV